MHPARSRRPVAGLAAAGVAAAGPVGTGVTLAAPAQAVPSSSVVISEVYGGGGNSGATYTHDFVELYNLGPSEVGLAGWTVRYTPASGGTSTDVPLTGALLPGCSYLVQLAKGAGGTQPLSTPSMSPWTACGSR
jgi:predicted extracellular nuclease